VCVDARVCGAAGRVVECQRENVYGLRGISVGRLGEILWPRGKCLWPRENVSLGKDL